MRHRILTMCVGVVAVTTLYVGTGDVGPSQHLVVAAAGGHGCRGGYYYCTESGTDPQIPYGTDPMVPYGTDSMDLLGSTGSLSAGAV